MVLQSSIPEIKRSSNFKSKNRTKNNVEVVRFVEPTGIISSSSYSKPPRQTRGDAGRTPIATTSAPQNQSFRQEQSEAFEQVAQLNAGALTGKARHRYLQNRLSELGLPNGKLGKQNNPKSNRPRVPLKMAMQMISKARERAISDRDKMRDMGMISESLSVSSSDLLSASATPSGIVGKGRKGGVLQHTTARRKGDSTGAMKSKAVTYKWTSESHPMKSIVDKRNATDRKKKVLGRDGVRWYERGLAINTGKYKNGVLHIPKRQISEIEGGKR